MSDEPTISERLSLGMRAEHELGLVRKAFEHIKREWTEAIANTTLDQKDRREQLYIAITVLPAVEKVLISYVNDAAAAKAELDAAELVSAAAERRQPREARH